MPKSPADRLIESHIKLVPALVARYRDYPVERDELVAAGNVGLVLAAQKFDATRGVQFSTYATYWITKEILVAVIQEISPWHAATMGAWKPNRFFRIRAIMRMRPREEWESRVADALHVSVTEAAKLLRDFVVVFAYDWDFERHAEDEPEDEPDMAPDRVRIVEWLRGVLPTMTEQERAVLTWRYLDRRELAYSEIGARLGVSRQRAEQIAKLALRRLREKARKEGIAWP